MAKGLSAASNQAAIAETKIALQGQILAGFEALATAKAAQADSDDRVRALEREIEKLKNWDSEKRRYRLSAIGFGAYAYVPRAPSEDGGAPHWLCTTCFDRGEKAILQTRGKQVTDQARRGILATWGCNTCKGEVLVGYNSSPASPSSVSDE